MRKKYMTIISYGSVHHKWCLCNNIYSKHGLHLHTSFLFHNFPLISMSFEIKIHVLPLMKLFITVFFNQNRFYRLSNTSSNSVKYLKWLNSYDIRFKLSSWTGNVNFVNKSLIWTKFSDDYSIKVEETQEKL